MIQHRWEYRVLTESVNDAERLTARMSEAGREGFVLEELRTAYADTPGRGGAWIVVVMVREVSA